MDSNPCGHLSLIPRIATKFLTNVLPPVNIFALDYASNKRAYVYIYLWSGKVLTDLLNFHAHLSIVEKILRYLIFRKTINNYYINNQRELGRGINKVVSHDRFQRWTGGNPRRR